MCAPYPSILLVLLGCVPAIRADAPLPPPQRYEVQSPSRKYVATLDPKTGVEVRASNSAAVLWRSKVWSRVAFLLDDGEHFVTGYSGMNLIPLDYSKDLVLLSFWKRDQKIRDVTVSELFPDTRVLRRTASHYHWGSITGLTNSTLIVTRCDGNEVRFDAATGKVKK
jgi:hypothetical protein